jgi:guanine deaminase
MRQEQPRRAFHGTVYHSLGLREFECLTGALIGVDSTGVIAFVERNVTDPAETLKKKGWQDVELWTLAKGEFLIPG